MNENGYGANLREQCRSGNDISCKHSKDTPEVVFAYVSLTLGQENENKEYNTCK